MKYNMRYFQENAKVIREENRYGGAWELDGHKIGYMDCDSSISWDYFFVYVDGKTIATRTRRSEVIRKALAYLNKNA